VLTAGQVLDFGAARDGVPERRRGRRIVVDQFGKETRDVQETVAADPDAAAA